MQNNKKAVILAVILLLIALGITIYPLIANALAEKFQLIPESASKFRRALDLAKGE